METTRPARLAALYACTSFVSAFLLFQIQPLISRFILPWFGGTPAVWTTCLVFFQTALFGGYAYAHLSEHYLRPRARTIVHLTLIVAALLTLPIAPSDWWKPTDSDYPAARILALLAVCVGLPYFLLSSTGPLVQAWFSQTLPGRSPYRLYSLSNLGSLLALLSYPFVVEPLLDGHQQSWCWTAGFVLFCILCARACWQTARLRPAQTPALVNAEASADDEPAPSWLRRLLWLALPAFASVLLLATTNHICLDVPAVPFLWVAPLSLYLLSFIIAFDHQRWYRRMPFALAALFTCYFTAILSNPTAWGNWMSGLHGLSGSLASTSWLPMLGYWQSLCLQLAVLFLLSMLCHGELVRLRPSARYLTSFYLMISAGGALGGLSVSLIAPLVFTTYAEWKISLIVGFVLAAAVAFVVTDWTGSKRPTLNSRTLVRGAGIAASLIAFPDIVYMLQHEGPSRSTVLERTARFLCRFDGAGRSTGKCRESCPHLYPRQHPAWNTIHRSEGPPASHDLLHRNQWRRPDATVLSRVRGGQRQAAARRSHRPGAGTLAAWITKPGQTIRFYEIDPEVYRLAEKYFTFLEDAGARGAKVDVVLGDARLSLEHELAEPQTFDVLVIDAFSSDSPPIHLLTKEAFELYRKHLAPQGAIAVNITNRFLNLAPVVFGLAESVNLEAVQFASPDIRPVAYAADWVIVSRNQELLQTLRAANTESPPEPTPPLPLWTDQRHNLVELLERRMPPSRSRPVKRH